MKKENSILGKAAVRRTLFLTLLAASYLQYYFVGVLTEIESLPTVVVFVPAKALG